MTTFLSYLVIGGVVGCIYALSAVGLVVTYTTSGIFNFAHGGVGMIAAFAYWQLSVAWHWPPVIALLAVVLVGAPLAGAVIERILMRRLQGQALEVQLVVTVGLLVFLIGVANLLWNPTSASRVSPRFFPGHRIKISAIYIDFHEALVVVVAAVIAIALRTYFVKSRTGVAMRAVVDNPALAAMNGARPYRISQFAWALGSSLAALAGILLAPLQTLNIVLLTLSIINAFAAAAFGRLRSIPLTVGGALVLGMFTTFAVGYLPASGFLSRAESAIPMLLLFGALILTPQERLRSSRTSNLQSPPVPSRRRAMFGCACLIGFALVSSSALSPIDLARGSRAFIYGMILLSLVLLVGYGGQVSLAQLTFVGLGAYGMAHFGHGGNPLGLLVAALLAAVVGAAVALPTLRLRGLYLALATLAFAVAMDAVFFGQALGAYGEGLTVERVSLPFVAFASDRSYFIFTSIAFAGAAYLVLAIRRGSWGRKLAALNDSPQACATLGVNIQYTKLAVFAASAGLAGFGGALYGGQQHVVTGGDFVMLNSLTLLLLLLVGGRNTVTGALLGAAFFAVVFPIAQQHFPSLNNIQLLLTGLAAITVGQNPNGIAGQFSALSDLVHGRRGDPARSRADSKLEQEDASLAIASA